MCRDEVARVYELFLILMSGCYPPHEPHARGQAIILQECNKPAGIYSESSVTSRRKIRGHPSRLCHIVLREEISFN